MIPVSIDYKRQLIAGNRNYLIKADVWLADNATNVPDFTLTNEEIWDNGITIDQAISDDSSFTIGAAIVGSLQVVINNINSDFSQYDFYDAKITLYLGVTGDVDEHDVQRYYRIGFYVVDEPSYNGSLITLNCLDNMTWFDVPFENITTTNTTAGQLVQNICSHVGVLLGTPQFPNYAQAIDVELDQKLNCREVLQYVAQMCCCYCKMTTAGKLALKWYNKQEIIGITDYDGGTYNTNTTPYSDGCNLDGGHFNPWDGDSADGGTFADLMNSAFLSQNFEISVSTDDVVVTGCRVRNTTSNDDAYDYIWVDPNLEPPIGTHERYVLVIENNPFITSENANDIATNVGSILAGLPVRGFSSSSLSDFSYETGDMVTVIDFRGNRYYTWITHFTFTTNNSETFSCGVESFRKRSEERLSDSVKTLAEANNNASTLVTEYDAAVSAMNDLAQEAIGYNKYETNINGATVTWLYNGSSIDTTDPSNPTFTGSSVVFKISGDGVFVSHDGGINYDNGYDANSGTAILSLLYAVGISCDWLKTGTITLGGYNNMDGKLVAYANSTLSSGSYSGTTISIPIGYSQVQKAGNTLVDITISNISSAVDYKGKYRLYHTTDGSTFNKIEESYISEGITRVATPLEIVNNPSNYYVLYVEEQSPFTATFDYAVGINKIVTTIDRNGIATTNGSFSGNISGSAISGSSFYLENGGDIVDISSGRIKTQGTWIQLCKSLTNVDDQHLALGHQNSAYISHSPDYQRTVGSKWLIQAAYESSQGSDKRLKKKIKTIAPQLSKDLITQARPVSFYYKEDDKEAEEMKRGKSYGVIAQEIRKVLDDLGETDAYLEHSMHEGNDYRAVEYKEFIPHLINYAQDLQKQIDDLKQELADLKARVK